MAMRDEMNLIKKKHDDLNKKLNKMCPCKPISSACGKFKRYHLT